MSLFIDSARISEIQRAVELGWVRGITTNPILLAQAQREPEDCLQTLKSSGLKPIFYQLTAESLAGMHSETQRIEDILENQLVLKIPPTELGFRYLSEQQRIPCCPTAIFSSAQALLAREAGARYIAVYVNRATQFMGDGLRLLEELADILEGSATEILAASLKSTEEVVAAHLAGAQHLTMPLSVLESLRKNEFSTAAMRSFRESGRGL